MLDTAGGTRSCGRTPRSTGSPTAPCGSTCPTGDIYGTGNTGPTNFVLQTAPTGDWTLETKVDGSLFNEQYQQGGLIVYGDDDNYVKLDFVVDNHGRAAGQPAARVPQRDRRGRAEPAAAGEQPDLRGVAPAADQKAGDAFTASYSADGTDLDRRCHADQRRRGGQHRRWACSPSAPPQTASKRRRSTTSGSAPPRWTRRHRSRRPPCRGTPTGGWYTGPVTVTLAATDNAGGSGVDGRVPARRRQHLDGVHRAGAGQRRRHAQRQVPVGGQGGQRRPSRPWP